MKGLPSLSDPTLGPSGPVCPARPIPLTPSRSRSPQNAKRATALTPSVRITYLLSVVRGKSRTNQAVCDRYPSGVENMEVALLTISASKPSLFRAICKPLANRHQRRLEGEPTGKREEFSGHPSKG